MRSFHHLHGADGLLVAVGEQGQIRHCTGAAFEARPTPTQADLLCAWVHDHNHAWAAGQGGTLLRWDGSVWTALDTGTRQPLHAVWAADPDNVWAGGTGVLLRWRSDGEVMRLFLDHFTVRLIWGSGPDEVWCLGSAPTLIHWDGCHWRYIDLPDQEMDLCDFRWRASRVLQRGLRPMPKGRFWPLVAALGWGRRTTDYKKAGAQLMRRLPIMDLLRMELRFEDWRMRLHGRIEVWEEEANDHVGTQDNEAFQGLLGHIVGLGKEEFRAALRDPSLAARRAQTGDYEKSFARAVRYYIEADCGKELAQALRAHAELRPWALAESYHLGDVLDHPELGPGIVWEKDRLRPGLVKVLFSVGGRLLPLKLTEDPGPRLPMGYSELRKIGALP